jgi:hypothetical protein
MMFVAGLIKFIELGPGGTSSQEPNFLRSDLG